MESVDRLKEHIDDPFDKLILWIRTGTIKSGRLSHLVKIDKNKQMKGKVFFDDGEETDDSGK